MAWRLQPGGRPRRLEDRPRPRQGLRPPSNPRGKRLGTPLAPSFFGFPLVRCFLPQFFFFFEVGVGAAGAEAGAAAIGDRQKRGPDWGRRPPCFSNVSADQLPDFAIDLTSGAGLRRWTSSSWGSQDPGMGRRHRSPTKSGASRAGLPYVLQRGSGIILSFNFCTAS